MLSTFCLLTQVSSVSELSDRVLLLESRALPGGGEEEGLPSNTDSLRGGKLEREKLNHGAR